MLVSRMLRYLYLAFGIIFLDSILGAGGAFFVFYKFGRDLPEYRQLADFELPVMTRIHVGDGNRQRARDCSAAQQSLC